MRHVLVMTLMIAVVGGCKHKTEVTKEDPMVEPNKYQPKPMELRKKIGVVDFVDKSNYGRHRLGQGASDILTNMLVNSEQFLVIEREQLSKVLDEQKLGGSGVIDPSTAANVGKVIGLSYIVYGSIVNFGVKATYTNIMGVRNQKWICDCTVQVRLIDTSSGAILYSQQGDGRAETKYTKVFGQGTSGTYDERLPGESLQAAIAKMIDVLIAKAP